MKNIIPSTLRTLGCGRFLVILAALCLVACSDSSKKGKGEKIDDAQQEQLEMSTDSIMQDKERAATDTAYAHSEDYRYAQENYHRHLAEATKGMSHADQLLVEYELAVKDMNELGAKVSKHPNLGRNQDMMLKLKVRGEEALKLHDKLALMKLTPEQTEKFKEINNQR